VVKAGSMIEQKKTGPSHQIRPRFSCSYRPRDAC